MKVYERSPETPAVMFNAQGNIVFEFDTATAGMGAKPARIEVADDDLHTQCQLIEAGAVLVEDVQ